MRVEMFSMFCIGSIVGITVMSILSMIIVPLPVETVHIQVKTVEVKTND